MGEKGGGVCLLLKHSISTDRELAVYSQTRFTRMTLVSVYSQWAQH